MFTCWQKSMFFVGKHPLHTIISNLMVAVKLTLCGHRYRFKAIFIYLNILMNREWPLPIISKQHYSYFLMHCLPEFSGSETLNKLKRHLLSHSLSPWICCLRMMRTGSQAITGLTHETTNGAQTQWSDSTSPSKCYIVVELRLCTVLHDIEIGVKLKIHTVSIFRLLALYSQTFHLVRLHLVVCIVLVHH